MRGILSLSLALLLAIALAALTAAADENPRLALVIGNSQYKTAPLATPANDAALVAQTLQTAGFDVTAAADLDHDALHNALRDFAAKAQQAGPNAIIFVYLAGRGLQYAGENYFVPIDAVVQRDADIPVANVRLTEFTRALAAAPAKARIIVLDGARRLHFATEGAPFASGFAIVDPEPDTLYAFNAAPGTVAPDEVGPYGAYAQALVEMIEQGLPLDQIFGETRLRVDQLTEGGVVPWNASQDSVAIALFTRDASAPALQTPADTASHALDNYPPSEAYWIAVGRDTIGAYESFLKTYPRDPLALRVRAMLAARREALTWRRAVDANTPEAYWTYMRRYARGPHFADARRRLAALAAPLDPPPRFDPFDFQGLPPPSDDEAEIVETPQLTFVDPSYPPPPLAPADLLPLRPVEFEHLAAPSPPAHAGLLPVAASVRLPYSKPILQTGIVSALAASGTESEAPNAPVGTPAATNEAKPQPPQPETKATSEESSAKSTKKAETEKEKAKSKKEKMRERKEAKSKHASKHAKAKLSKKRTKARATGKRHRRR